MCNASIDAIGKQLVKKLARLYITYRKKLEPLGAGLAGGRRRNTDVRKYRRKKFQKRTRKFRRLAKLGIQVDKLPRTGGTKAMTYGQAIMGVSDSMLQNQRRTTTAASPTTV